MCIYCVLIVKLGICLSRVHQMNNSNCSVYVVDATYPQGSIGVFYIYVHHPAKHKMRA